MNLNPCQRLYKQFGPDNIITMIVAQTSDSPLTKQTNQQQFRGSQPDIAISLYLLPLKTKVVDFQEYRARKEEYSPISIGWITWPPVHPTGIVLNVINR